MSLRVPVVLLLLAGCGASSQTVVVQPAPPAPVVVQARAEVHVPPGGMAGVPFAATCPGVSVQDAGETRSGRALGMAILQVAARPWVDVVVDGRPEGRTPLVAVGVEAGPREIRIVAAELGYDCTMRLHAQGGRRYAISVDTEVAGPAG